jgi:hypothetical protein
MFYKPGEYEIKGGEFFSAKSGEPLNSGDLVGLVSYCEPDDISPIETYGKEVMSIYREAATLDGKATLYKSAVIKI